MPLSRRAQDPRVGYVAIMVCDVLTHLMKAMLEERRVSNMLRPRAAKSQNSSLLLKAMKLL